MSARIVDKAQADEIFVSEIVRGICALVHGLGLDVVAEGVETLGQLDILRELGCKFGQGFLFSRPVPGEEATALIAEDPEW